MLTERQQRFVDLYAGPGTGLATARAAGYEGSDATLKVTASQLLRVPDVAAALEARGVAIEADAADPTSPEEVEAARAGLDAKARRFIDAYLKSGAIAKAARRAKISESAARRLLARADVRVVIEAERTRQALEGIANAREQQIILTTIARNKKAEHADRVRAVSALATIQRGLAPATGRSGEVGAGVRVQQQVIVVTNGRGPLAVESGRAG